MSVGERELCDKASAAADRAVDRHRSANGANPIGQSAEATASRRIGAANAVVPNLDAE
jgi:hypothetical protein